MRLAALLALVPLLARASPVLNSADSHQLTFPPSPAYDVHPSIQAALALHKDDPVAAMLSLKPELEAELAEPRLLEVDGNEAVWMTEGDKMRLRREGKFFIDLTERQDAIKMAEAYASLAGKAHTPELVHQPWVKPCFPDISTKKMHDVLKHMTSFYSRYYHSTDGARSARWLHDHIAEIIAQSPFQSYISLEYHTHTFAQPSIIARFEPAVRNASLPYTIIGAHQDSANYNFPLLPAPGADDDCSGTVSILEAFRVLATRGFIPQNGPVEFHWYAAEEAGLFGSLAMAGYKKDIGAKVGAMLEFDMTAYIRHNTTESIGIIRTEADDVLTDWVAKLAKEYSKLNVDIYDLGHGAGSDYMSWTRFGYPSAFASEGNPLNGGFPGDFDPYVHTTEDKMTVNDAGGVFSIDHMARFTELAIAFVVEQAGWSSKHSRESDGHGDGLWEL